MILGQPTESPTAAPTELPTNKARNPEAKKGNVKGMNSYSFDSMTDGVTGCCGQYQAYYASSSMPSRMAIDLGRPYACSAMRFFSITTAARPKHFRVVYSTDNSVFTELTITGKTDGTTSFSGTRATAGNSDAWHGVKFGETVARYWAFLGVDGVYNNGNNNAGLSEIEWICRSV